MFYKKCKTWRNVSLNRGSYVVIPISSMTPKVTKGGVCFVLVTDNIYHMNTTTGSKQKMMVEGISFLVAMYEETLKNKMKQNCKC